MFIILKTELRISTTGKHVYEIELLELKPRKTTKLSRLIRYKCKYTYRLTKYRFI